MANQFDVTPLGGFNLGAGIQQLGQTLERREEQVELKRQREQMQKAILGARKGDKDSIDTLYTLNPDLANQIETQARDLEERGILKSTRDAAIQLVGSAPGSMEREVIKERIFLDDSIDFGEDEQNMTDEQLDLAANLFLRQQGIDLSKGAPSIGTYNPRDYTVESFAEFRRTGDPSKLERYEKDQFKEIGGVTYRLNPATNQYDQVVSPEKIAQTESTISGREQRLLLRRSSKSLNPYLRTFRPVSWMMRILSISH